jgi:hypothetical protein
VSTATFPSNASISKSFRIPVRVWRPLLTGEALGRSPLVEARRAYPASVEGVPHMPAVTSPAVCFARRPTTFGASDAWAGGVEVPLFIHFVISSNGGLVVREGRHAAILCHARETTTGGRIARHKLGPRYGCGGMLSRLSRPPVGIDAGDLVRGAIRTAAIQSEPEREVEGLLRLD